MENNYDNQFVSKSHTDSLADKILGSVENIVTSDGGDDYSFEFKGEITSIDKDGKRKTTYINFRTSDI